MIDRIDFQNAEVLRERYLAPSRPVIVCGAMVNWRATSWTPDYLRSVVGLKTVKVAASSNGIYKYNPMEPAFEYRNLQLSAAIDLMQSSTEESNKYYIMQRSLQAEFRELLDDLVIPSLFCQSDLDVVNLWVGSAGNVTPLHFDGVNNLLCQVYGRKRVNLFSPDQTRYIYQMPAWSRFNHVSQVDIDDPDLTQYPLFKKASPIELVLEPGEMLFLPSFWWHHVRSIDLSISVNFWWKTHVSQYFVPNALSCLPAMFDRNRLGGLSVAGGLMALATHARESADALWVATLCAAAAFDQHARKLLRKHDIDAEAIPGRMTAVYSKVANLAGMRVAHLDTRRLNSWSRLVAMAKSADDRQLPTDDVAEMVNDIERFIASSSL